jgi:hypothetical protein
MGWRCRRCVSTLDVVFIWAKDGGFHVGKTDIFVLWPENVDKLWLQPTRLHDITANTTHLSREIIFFDMCSEFWS